MDDFIPSLLHELEENVERRAGGHRPDMTRLLDPHSGKSTYLYLRGDVIDWLNAEAARLTIERRMRVSRSQVVNEVLRVLITQHESGK